MLQNMFRTIAYGYIGDNDITRWIKQGVLLLVPSPTWAINGQGHHEIWRPFIVYLINRIEELYPNIPWMFTTHSSMDKWDVVKSKHKLKWTSKNYTIWEDINNLLETPMQW